MDEDELEYNPEDIDEETGEIGGEVEYRDLVTEEPERHVDYVLPEEYDGTTGVSEAEEESPQKSDIQAVLAAISPKFKHKRINDLVQSAMVSRIFPDNLLDKQKLIVLSLLEEYDEEDENIPVIDIIMGVQDALSIGYEGRGIVERLEIAGVAHEQEMEQLAKDLGI